MGGVGEGVGFPSPVPKCEGPGARGVVLGRTWRHPLFGLRWDATRASRGATAYGSAAGDAGAEQRFGDAVHDEVGIAADGRGEVRVGGRGQGEVALVDLGVARLAERAQHQVTEDALFGLALDARGELLIHARRDGDVFGHFVLARIAAAAARFAALAAEFVRA